MSELIKGERRIGRAHYTIHQIPFSEARALFWSGASIVAPMLEAAGKIDLGKLLAGDASELLDGEVDVEKLGKAIRIFFDRASYADFQRFEEAFASRTLVKPDGAKHAAKLTEIAELHWPSVGYGDFVKWFGFSVQVHFFPLSLGSGRVAVASPGASTA